MLILLPINVDVFKHQEMVKRFVFNIRLTSENRSLEKSSNRNDAVGVGHTVAGPSYTT